MWFNSNSVQKTEPENVIVVKPKLEETKLESVPEVKEKRPLFYSKFVVEIEIELKLQKEDTYAIKQSKEMCNMIRMIGDVKSATVKGLKGVANNKQYDINK